MTPTQEAVAAGAIAGGLVSFIIITTLAIYLIFVVAWWKIFKKAGIAGWKSIIPFYNFYLIYRISGMSGWWILLPIISSILMSCGATYIYDDFGNATQIVSINAFGVIGYIGAFASVIVEIVQNVKLSGNFGKGTLFKVCSVLFTPITTLILGFGGAKYNKKALHK